MSGPMFLQLIGELHLTAARYRAEEARSFAARRFGTRRQVMTLRPPQKPWGIPGSVARGFGGLALSPSIRNQLCCAPHATPDFGDYDRACMSASGQPYLFCVQHDHLALAALDQGADVIGPHTQGLFDFAFVRTAIVNSGNAALVPGYVI